MERLLWLSAVLDLTAPAALCIEPRDLPFYLQPLLFDHFSFQVSILHFLLELFIVFIQRRYLLPDLLARGLLF